MDKKKEITGNRFYAYSALTMGTLAMVACFMAWSNFAPLTATLTKMFGLSESEKTLLLATPVLLGSIMRIPIGILCDKYGGKKIYIILMLFLLIPLFMVPRVHNFGMLIFLALLLGMAGTSFAVGISYVSVWFPPERQGAVLGIAGLGNIGNAVAALTLPRIQLAAGLSAVYNFLMSLLVVMIILFLIFCKEMPVNKEKTFASAFSVAKEANTWYLSLFYALTFGLFMSFSNLTPMLLNGLFNLTPVMAGLYAALFGIVCTLVRPVGGSLADKIRPMSLLQWIFIGIALFALWLTFSLHSEGMFIWGVIIIGLFAGLGNGIIFKMVPYVSKGNTGAVTGFVGAMGGLGGYFPPIVIGFIKTWTGSYQLGIILLVLAAILCWIVLYRVFIHGGNRIVQ
ncbi:NarK/NasA family nitrate transporter [Sporolactobacillus sp. CQH2019]|uniref:nitrate/nitrite transporter n=1 Tax=Sporolactobacillus sp. CQH2019 TaxID=3023512 RepID=UPI002368BB5D|nr:nitrate/nitrite transporter [Sporolactobacillus sp. CQH2019]MDD9149613.1 NarK/NasA family nitrate transporter [Sporolactobacillus sp. CQH2019]